MKYYTENPEKKDTRSGFGEGLLEAARLNPKIVALCADLTESVKMHWFKKEFSDRFFQVGIAEANMISIAAGLATAGYIPFAASFANFITARVYDQIRQSVAYSEKNVKICGSHSGLTVGEDGATHQILEDIGLMKTLPNMTVIVPCDFNQTKAATLAIAKFVGPVYLRFGRPPVPNFTEPNQEFIIGKAQILKEGNDVSIFATGHLVWYALKASQMLAEEGIDAEIINIHTIKPIDVQTILLSVQKTKCAVTAEEHLINSGLGDSIAQILVRYFPAPLEMVGVYDKFGESGTPEQLLQKYGLTAENICKSAIKVIERKHKYKTDVFIARELF